MAVPEYPQVRLDRRTELRTHGVSGTPVESMLHHPHPMQVWGDRQAGYYRRPDEHAAPGDDVPEGRNLEAYSWGGLTSGRASRAFWLLLAPFTLANVASWVHPVRPKVKFAPIGAMSGLIRVFALSLTGTFVLATATAGMDIIAWQCANREDTCAEDHFFTEFMTREGTPFRQPGVRLALGTLLPLAVLGALFWLARSTSRAYEDYRGKDGAGKDRNDPSGAADLAAPRFWAGGKPLSRLRSLHAATALALVAGLLAYAASRGPADAPLRWLGVGVVWAAAALAGFCVLAAGLSWSGRRGELLHDEPPPRAACLAMDWSKWAGLALFGTAVWYAWFPAEPDPGVSSTLPGLNELILGWFVGQIVTLALYLAATAWARIRSPRTKAQTLFGRTLFLSCGGTVLATIALGAAGAYASGLVFRVADYLGDPAVVRDGPIAGPEEFGLHGPYFAAARAAALAVVFGVLVGVGTVVWLRRRAKRCEATVRREYGDLTADDPDRVRAIAKAQASASLTDRADMVVMAFLLPTTAGTAALWTLSTGFWLFPHVGWVETLAGTATTAGTWLVGVLAIGLVLLGRSAYGSDQLRRTVGILWDLGTFWPRAAHPFAPPCYCERVVPELAARIGQITAAKGGVVLSAHSQGTVIAVATLHRLGPGGTKKVRLLTYGSPVERLYARLFPHFFGLDELAKAHALVGRWRNLYRRTDPIGGPVFRFDAEGWRCDPGAESPPPRLAGVDEKLLDPEFAVEEGAFQPPPCRGHSDYFHDPRFAAAVTELADTLRA